MGMKNVSLYDIPLDLFLKYYSKNASLNSKLEGYRELQNNSFKNPELFFEVPDKTLSLVKKTPNDLWLGYRDGDIITKTQLKNAYGECFKYINDDGEEAIRFNFSSDVIREEFMNTPGKYIYHILEESSRKVKIDTAEGNITIPVSLKKLSIRVSIDGQPEYIITPSIINKEIQLIIAIPTSSEEKSFRFKIDFLNNNKTVGSDTYVFKNPAKDSIGNIKKRFPEDTRFQQSGFIMYKLSIPVNYENELQEYIVYLENFESIALSPSAKRNNDLYITKPEINKFTILGVERVPSNIGAIPSTLTLQKVIPYPVSSTLTIPENLEGKYELYDVFNAFYNIDALYQSYRGTSEDAIVGTDLDSNSVSYRKQAIKIYEYYSNKEKIEYFSPAGYNSKMYGILEDIDNKLLPHLHWDIMVPIYKYYNSKNSITSHDINIHDALLSEKPGKKILFSIANIPDSTIYTDIQNDKIGIKKYLYSTTLNETGVILTLK